MSGAHGKEMIIQIVEDVDGFVLGLSNEGRVFHMQVGDTRGEGYWVLVTGSTLFGYDEFKPPA
tara:strand:+ start:136 stop:324 length:189 start_codon:yes stop_codon:yes gene_type:complete